MSEELCLYFDTDEDTLTLARRCAKAISKEFESYAFTIYVPGKNSVDTFNSDDLDKISSLESLHVPMFVEPQNCLFWIKSSPREVVLEFAVYHEDSVELLKRILHAFCRMIKPRAVYKGMLDEPMDLVKKRSRPNELVGEYVDFDLSADLARWVEESHG